ncbi:hypothetical protein [Ralstonia wenshanensis]|uniref:hypothetical protein n=1 Tax=Ralstonia wenshanensis TaxID=2842456 RepID=UPI00292E2D55|nr:hypothetical protein [Ralstonia wenshanensis]
MLLTMLSCAVISSAPAFAQQATPANKGGQTAQTQTNVAEFDKKTAAVRENMKKMQEEMDKARQTQDPKERQKLLDEHWATMQSTMGMMRELWGPGMMGGPGMRGGHMMGGGPMMGWRGMGGYYSRLTPEQMKERQYMSDQYMDLHYEMMEQMMLNHQMWRQMPR